MNGIAPASDHELLNRACALAGKTLGEIANRQGSHVPQDFRHDKGWVGSLIEAETGVSVGSQAGPDFPHLGIELKTLPLSAKGQPKESTFICVASLTSQVGITWQESLVRSKLDKVLWVPFEASAEIPIADRKIKEPFLWHLTPNFEKILQEDWEAAMDKIALGELDTLLASEGTYLQVRPKAAHARSLCWGFDQHGNKVKTLPRGFYLRVKATRLILESAMSQPLVL